MTNSSTEPNHDEDDLRIAAWRKRMSDALPGPALSSEKPEGPVDEDAIIDRWRAQVTSPTDFGQPDDRTTFTDEMSAGTMGDHQTSAQLRHEDVADAERTTVGRVTATPPRPKGLLRRLRNRFVEGRIRPEHKRHEDHASPARPDPLQDWQTADLILQQTAVNRRKHRAGFAAKFLFAILLPTAGVWYYVNHVAVPLYTASAVISVTKPAPDANAAGLGILGAMGGGGQMREAFMVLEYTRSPAAFAALEKDLGLISYYSGTQMDPVGRVRDLDFVQITQAQSLGRYIKSSIDVQNGLISTSIRARSREDALTFLAVLLTIAEGHMNDLSAKLFDERMAQANGAVIRAQDQLERAQLRLVEVQIENGEVDPQATIAGIYEAINLLEADRLDFDRRILALEAAGNETSPIMPQYRSSRQEIDQLIALQRARLIDNSSGKSLNEKLSAHEAAKASVLVAEQILAAALASQNEARQAAELGVSRFQVVVPPQAPQIADYPQRWQTTVLAFFVFISLLAVVSIARPRSG